MRISNVGCIMAMIQAKQSVLPKNFEGLKDLLGFVGIGDFVILKISRFENCL